MKKKLTFLTAAALALLAFLAFPMGMWGQTRTGVTWTASEQGYTNGESLDGVSIELDDYITIQFDKNDGNNAPAYYNTGTAARLYPKNSLTVTPASGYQITGMTLTFSGTGNTGTLGASGGSYSLSSATGTWSGSSTSAVVLTNNATSGHARMQVLTVTYSEEGSNPPTPTYTVTYDCNGGTSGCPENVTGIEAGEEITLADGPVKTDYDFAGWSDGTNIYEEGDDYIVNGNVTFTAQWTEQVSGDVHWVLTELADLTANDVFVIVGNNGSNYAMKNTDASNSGPAAIAVTVSGTELSGTVPDNIRWNISGNATDGYIFYPNGSTTTWLYCINNNNGLRIGDGNTDYNTFEIKASYIYNKGRGRYVGVYTASGQSIAQDWRSYTSSGGNIANQTFGFYKKVTGSVLPPSITANNVNIAYDATSGEIAYTLNNPASNGSLSASANVNWISNLVFSTTENKVTFTTTANEATTAREGIITITYTYGDNETVSKDVTVTQAAAPVIYTTIPDLFAAATGTETPVLVTFNNWVVSGVSSNGKNIFVTDNNGNGFVIYYTTDMSNTFAAGNILSGTAVSCNLKKYNGFAELLNVTATDLTITSGGTVTLANVAMADLAGVNTGALLHYDNLTCVLTTNQAGTTTFYNLTDGTTTIQVYNAIYAFGTLVEGKTYNITGIYQQYNNTKEILPRSAADIEEVIVHTISAYFIEGTYPDMIEVDAEYHEGELGCAGGTWQDYPGPQGVQFYDGNEQEADQPDWISISLDVEPGYDYPYTIAANAGEARSAYFKFWAYDDNQTTVIYSNLLTITQAAAPQQYILTVEPFENLEIITFVNDEMVMEADGEIEVNDGDHIMLSIVADEGYVMETLMVNGVNHVNDIADDFTYEFDMPAEDVTISATAVEYVAPAGGDYVRITSLDQLTDGSIVVIAARYDEEHTHGYYAMSNATSGKPTGVLFTSTTSGDNEVLPASITDNEDDYYWTVNETEDGYTFTNAEGLMIGYNSSTNFATGGSNTEWSIELSTSEGTAMVPNYTGFFITNVNNQARHFALNSSHNFGPYHDNNINNSGYNFCLDFFVQSESPATESYPLIIAGYGDNDNPGGWYLIATPVDGLLPTEVVGMTEGSFDLYAFDQNASGSEWQNYKSHMDGFILESGKGYLYANSANDTLVFTGTPYDGDGAVELDYNENAEFAGWNLVGNPFGVSAYFADSRDFYEMNGDGTGFTMASSAEISKMQGVFVVATEEGETVQFVTERPENTGKSVTLRLGNGRSTNIDAVRVRFEGGRSMDKLVLNEDATKLYIPKNGKDYAVMMAEAEGQMPVNFKAAANGVYTLNTEIENTKFSYLHLIDNLTGTDVDLLANPSYSFSATTAEYAARFTLVFAENTGVGENNDAPFAFISNGNIVVNGEGTLEMIDMMGRIVRCADVAHNISTKGMASGVYMLRLTNGNAVRTQKIVVE